MRILILSSLLIFMLFAVSCNKDTNELPPIEVRELSAKRSASFSGKPFLEAHIQQQISVKGEVRTELSWKNISGIDLTNVEAYYKLCSDDGMCAWEQDLRILDLKTDSLTAATQIYLPNSSNIQALNLTLELFKYNSETYLLAGRYEGVALFEIASGDSFFVNATGIIDLEGKCVFDLTYGDDERAINGTFADTSDFYGKLLNGDDIISTLDLGAYTDTSGNVTDVIYMDGDELGFKLDLAEVGSDSLFTISFDLLKN